MTTHKKTFLSLILLPVLFGFRGCAGPRSESIHTLIDQGKEEQLKEDDLRRQQATYEKVLKAAQTHTLVRGTAAAQIIKDLGAPVTVLAREGGEKWLYLVRDADWFSGARIYLIFDKDNRLEGWECAHAECGEDSPSPARKS